MPGMLLLLAPGSGLATSNNMKKLVPCADHSQDHSALHIWSDGVARNVHVGLSGMPVMSQPLDHV